MRTTASTTSMAAAAAMIALAAAVFIPARPARAADEPAEAIVKRALEVALDPKSKLTPAQRDDVLDEAEKALLARKDDEKTAAFLFECLSGKRKLVERGRVWICDLVARIPGDGAETALLAALKDNSGLVLKRAVKHLGLRKCVRAIDPVIDLLGRTENTRDDPWLDCVRFLNLLTSKELAIAADWRSWWASHREGFDPAKVKPGAAPGSGMTVERKGGSPFGPTYVASRRFVLVLDVSKSMLIRDPPGEKTRMERLKDALRRLIEGLPAGTRFTIVTFGSRIESFRPELVPADAATKKAALEFAEGMNPEGLTPTDEALRTAFTFEDANAIYLLSDGVPQRGPSDYIPTDSILEEVAALNRLRRLKIHTIGIGQADRKFMQQLAAANEGTYTEAK